MTKWYIYNNETGVFTGVSLDCPADHLNDNVPEGCGCIMGPVDTTSQQVDMTTGQLTTYRPPQPSADYAWDDITKTWVFVEPLSTRLAKALSKCYTDIDTVVRDAVGERAEEYKEALADAQAFADSGYAEPAPESVAKFAQKNPTMQIQTNTWAAQQVIGRATALANARKSMRDQRFDSQYDMRAATNVEELDNAVAAWDAFILSIRAQLGL
jgi:hypothetical protein